MAPHLPAVLADIDITDLAALSPRDLFLDRGLLVIPDETRWAARALVYAQTGPSDSYDEIGLRFMAANPWKDRTPLRTRAGMRLARERDANSLLDDDLETLREQQPLLRHRPLDLPRAIDADISYDRRFLHVHERVESSSARPRTDTWTFPLTAPPASFLAQARPADAPLIGSQRQQLRIPGARWIPLSLVIESGSILRMQDWQGRLVSELEAGRFHAFISHRWLLPNHPDQDHRQAQFVAWQLVAALCDAVRVAHARGLHEPRRFNDQLESVVGVAGHDLAESLIVNVLRPSLDGESLAAAVNETSTLAALVVDGGIGQAATDERLECLRAVVQERPVLQRLVERVLLWYDYGSMPQQPRSDEEEAQFRNDLQYMVAIQAVAHTLVVLDEPDEYLTRAWCTLEVLFGGEVGLWNTLVGSSRRLARDGEAEAYFMTLLWHYPHFVRRALLDTEVLRVQAPGDCLRRLQLGAADPRDVPYLYERMCHLRAPRQAPIAPSAIVTGVFPVPVVNQGTLVVVPRRQDRNVQRAVSRTDPFTLDWSACVQVDSWRDPAVDPPTVEEVPPFAPMEPLPHGHAPCHIAIVASCEAEALMIGRWVRARGAELGRGLDNVTVVSMSWLANDIAPVGQMVHGALQARPVDARVWAVVAFAARFDACPVTVALTETLLECAIPYFEVRVDEASDNATFVAAAQRTRATAEERSRFEAVPIGRQRFESHAGGLFQANVPGHL